MDVAREVQLEGVHTPKQPSFAALAPVAEYYSHVRTSVSTTSVPYTTIPYSGTVSMSTAGKPEPKALQGFTVPQLKALCKEQKIAGYSKLGKAALIEKLSVVLRKGRNEQKDATGSSTQQTQLPTDLTRPESVYVGAKTQSTLPGQPGDANNAHIVGENVRQRYPELTENGMLSLLG